MSEVQSILTKYGINAKVNNLELQKSLSIVWLTKRPAIENAEANIIIVDKPWLFSFENKVERTPWIAGDGVLELITKYYLYRRYPKADEGFMTEKKSR